MIPIIRIELQSMKETLSVAIHEHLLKQDEMIQAAINAITPEQVTELINQEIKKILKESVQNSLSSYYLHGNGSEKIKTMVKEILDHGTR